MKYNEIVKVLDSNGETIKNATIVINTNDEDKRPYVNLLLGKIDVLFDLSLNGYRLLMWIVSRMEQGTTIVRLYHEDYTNDTFYDYGSFRKGINELLGIGIIEKGEIRCLYYVNQGLIKYVK